MRTTFSEKFHLFVGSRRVAAAIWGLQAAIFLFDLLTHPENVSACFAYLIPIFISLFEFRPRPYLYAATATVLSLIGSVVEPFDQGPFAAIIGNRLIAIAAQWLAALLVTLQYQRHTHVQREADLQRRFIDILSHEIGTALTAITGHAYRLNKLSGQLTPADLRVRADKIQKAAERIEAIINRIQLMSSLGDVIVPMDVSMVDINAMLQRLVSTTESSG